MLNLTSPIDPAGRELPEAAWKPSRTCKIINFQCFFITLHCFSLFFYVFCCFLLLWMGWDGVGMVRMWWRMDGKGSVLLGGYFLYIFSGFAIDRSKKYIKTIKIDRKIGPVDP